MPYLGISQGNRSVKDRGQEAQAHWSKGMLTTQLSTHALRSGERSLHTSLCSSPLLLTQFHWCCGLTHYFKHCSLFSRLIIFTPFAPLGAIFLFYCFMTFLLCLPVSVSFLSVSHALHLQKVIFPRQDDVLISFLPLAHMFERVIQVRNLSRLTRALRGSLFLFFFQSQWSPTFEDAHISYLPLAHMFERMVQVRSQCQWKSTNSP